MATEQIGDDLLTILLTIIILGVMIIFHETGHFVVAKLADVHVMEFAIGMGPKVFSRKRGETAYSLRAIPIGGFVRMAGEDPDDGDDPRGIDKKSAWQRIAIMAAGAMMNFVLAVLLFSIVVFFQGVPDNQAIIGEVFPDLPAQQVGIQAGDRILSINGIDIESWQDVTKAIKNSPETVLQIKIARDNQTINLTVTTLKDEVNDEGYIGIGPHLKRGSLFSSLIYGFEHTLWIINFLITAIVGMFTGKVAAEGAGPLGIAQMVSEVSQTGFLNLMSFTAMLSINVGIFNLVPIPPLDGSRILFVVVEILRGKPIDPKKENFIYFLGFALLILFAVLITYQDILRIYLQ